MNENKEIVVSSETTISNSLDRMNKVKKFTTLSVETEEDVKKIYNATQDCDVRLNDIVNQEIEIEGIYIEERPTTTLDDETGEVKEGSKFRTILFGTDGKSYVAGAYGIYNSISEIIGLFGFPTPEKPMKLLVKKRPICDGKETLVLKYI